jgi:transposase
MSDDREAALLAENELLKAELKLQRERVDYLMRQLYGAKSEKLDAGQLELLLDPDAAKKPSAAGSADAAPVAEAKDKPAARKRDKQDRLRASMRSLLTFTEELLPEEVRAEPAAYDRIGEEASERLEVIPARFHRHLIVRPVFVRRGDPDAKPVIAPLPTALLESSVLTPSLGAHLLSQKYCHHQPFHRQEWQLRHAHGIDLTRNLMCHWQQHLAGLLKPLHDLFAAELRQSGHLQVDETPIDYLRPGSGKVQKGYLWTYYNPRIGVLYDWHPGRAHDCLDAVLRGKDGTTFRGVLQTDGYAAYQTWIGKQPAGAITPVSCLAHIRREFYNARGDHPRLTGWILGQIRQLYRIEKKLRESRAGPRLRQAVRAAESRPIHRRLQKLFDKLAPRRDITPRSNLGDALNYARGQWSALLPCFEDGRIELDNNPVENAIRPTKLGAKNWLFIGREDTGWRSAVVYTFVENIRRAGCDPYAYLKWLFERLPGMTNQDDFRPLLPAAWLASRKQDGQEAAA